MASGTNSQWLVSAAGIEPGWNQACWYAAQVRANHEKSIAGYFECQSVEYYLPLYESVRRWKDRRVTLHLPLFPGYLLVRIRLRDRLQVLQAPGVARLVGFNGYPAKLEETEIDALREKLAGSVLAEPHPYLQMGRRVRVKRGPLEGFEGFLVRRKQKYRIVLSVDAILRSIAIEVDTADVESAPGTEGVIPARRPRHHPVAGNRSLSSFE